MFKLPKISFYILFIFLFIFTPSAVLAKSTANTLLPKTETYAGDYIKAGDTVTLSGTVEGDAYLAGSTVLVDGVVKGDLLVAGGTVTIAGEVGQNVRAVGGTININGWVGRNISLAGGNIHIGKDTVTGGNLTGFFGNLEYLGNQTGNMTFAAGNAYLNGIIEGNVETTVGSLVLGDSLSLIGDLTYTSKDEASVAPNTVISGVTNYKQAETDFYYPSAGKNARDRLQQGMKGFRKGFSFINFAAAMFIGYLFLRLFPRRTSSLMDIYARRPLRSIALGVLTFIAIPFTSFLFAITVIGLPISLLIMVMLAVIVYFAKIVIALYAGRLLLRKIGFGDRRGWALLLGLLIYFIIGGLPFVGPLVRLLVLFAGSGAIMTDIYRLFRSPSLRKIF